MEVFWYCLNRACGAVLAATAEEREEEMRACACGSPMQKREQPAVFSYLNFLREDGNAQPGMGTRKEPLS